MKKTAFIIGSIIMIGLLVSAFFYFKASMGVPVSTTGAVIELKNFSALKGEHCESSAMLNALHYQGVDLSENLINGFGSSMSFNLILNSGFPFLGTRNTYMKENFQKATGINFLELKSTNPQQAYDLAKQVLKRGIPVVLRVDMRYLPYLWNGRYGSKYTSFGWHFVTLVKLDERAGYAWVTDTSRGLCRIKIPDLMKARSSQEGQFKADNYAYYFVNPAAVRIDYQAALKHSLKTIINEYQKTDGTLAQLHQLPKNIENIEAFLSSKYMLKSLFFTFYGYIDEFGTGGNGFRDFYRDFLQELGLKLNNSSISISQTALAVDQSCQQWHTLAAEFKKISEIIDKYYGNSKKRSALYRKAAEAARDLYLVETEMLNQIKNLNDHL
jgi:hypothetical protein